MPSFGGEEERFPLRGREQDAKHASQPQHTAVNRHAGEQQETGSLAVAGTTGNVAKDDVDEGMSMEYADMEPTLAARIRMMEKHQKQVMQKLNRISAADSAVYGGDESETATVSRFGTVAVRSGIIWAEIVSPPKAKRRSRRRGI